VPWEQGFIAEKIYLAQAHPNISQAQPADWLRKSMPIANIQNRLVNIVESDIILFEEANGPRYPRGASHMGNVGVHNSTIISGFQELTRLTQQEESR
jgi:hypothetical protein